MDFQTNDLEVGDPLQKRRDGDLIKLLMIEIDFGFTLANTARIEMDMEEPAGFEMAWEKAQFVVQTVHNFQATVLDQNVRQNVLDRTEKLSDILCALRSERRRRFGK
jgi:hypothetical protein